MAVPMTAAQILTAFKAEGLTVREYPGWKRACRCCPDSGPHKPAGPFVRGWGSVNGQVAHITAGNLGNRTAEQYIRDIINGDSKTPLKSQTVIDPDGVVWVNSAGRCNHAGLVGAKVQSHMIAADYSTTSAYDARFRGKTADGNAFTYGDECIAASSMNAKQYDALVKVHAARARFHGWTGQESVGHGEISSARVSADPNLHMGKFRRDVMARVKAGTKPKPKPTTVKVDGLHWNIAGSDKNNGYAAENATRGPAVGAWAGEIGFDVFLACEAGQDNLRAGVSKGLGITSWEQRAKAIWLSPTSGIRFAASRKVYPDSIFAYLKTLKWGAAIFGTKDGKKFAFLEIHTDYRKPAKQAKQVQSIFRKFIADCDALGIPRENVVVAGDFNRDGTSGDNPFRALADWGFEEKGDPKRATFLTGKHLDGVLAHVNADVKVTYPDRANSKGVRLSDHFPIKFTTTLK